VGCAATGTLTGKAPIYTWRCVQFTHAPYGWLVGSWGAILRTADEGSRCDIWLSMALNFVDALFDRACCTRL